jgi:GPH family glycoside/pentoside/hexuronide:cation symporter
MSHRDFASPPESASQKLNLSTKLAYGAGDLGTAITANLLIFYLSPFFTDVAGLRPGLAAWTLLVGKIWDAVNDPMIGILSDRTQSRWGRRYPWMILGAVPFGLCFFLQWIVPHFSSDDTVNQWALFGYYTVISILFNSFYTIVNVPYTALTPELTQDYNERTSLNSFRFAFSIGGSILSVVIVGVIARLFPDSRTQQYLVMGAVCALLSALPLYWCVWGTRAQAMAIAGQQGSTPPAQLPTDDDEFASLPPWVQSLLTGVMTHLLGGGMPARWLVRALIVLTNGPFLFVVGIYLCSWLSLQLTATIIPYFVKSWMGFADPVVTVQVILGVQGTAMAMLFVWSAVSQRVGKKAVYFMGMSLWVIAQFGLFFLQPGQTGFMYVLAVLAGCGVSTAYLVPWSMLPDVIELDELKTGQRREGIFYSLMVFLQKISLGLAIAGVLQGLDWAGYVKPTAATALPTQPDAVLWVIRFSIGPLPTLALILGMVLAYFYPITREVHAGILLKLAERRTNSDNALP